MVDSSAPATAAREVAPWEQYPTATPPPSATPSGAAPTEGTPTEKAPWELYAAVPVQSPSEAIKGALINPADYENGAAPAQKALVGALPAAGMIGGGLLAGPPGAVVGGAGGALLKNYIENTIMGGKGTADQMLQEASDAGSSAMIGEATANVLPSVLKAATPAAASLLSGIPKSDIATYLSDSGSIQDMLKATGGSVAKAATLVQAKIASAVDSAIGNIEKPVWDSVGAKASGLSDAEAGQQVKQLLIADLREQHGPFLQAYGNLGEVNQSIALPDEARRDLTEGLKSYALDKFPSSPETYKSLKQIGDNINASSTGAHVTSVLNDIRTQLTAAYRAGDSNAIQALSEAQGRVESFMDQQVTNLAKRVAGGSASPADYMAFQKMADSQGIPQGENLAQYAKEIGSDFLANKDQVAADYSGLKDYLSFLQQQTGAKKSIGVGTLVKNIQAIPDEKLVSKMFTPNNAAALQRVSEETPEVFKQLAGQEIKGMMLSATDENGSLSLPDFAKQVTELPKEVRNLLFSPQEQADLMKTAADPRLQRLYELRDSGSPSLLKPGSEEGPLLSAGSGRDSQVRQQLGELSLLTGQNLMRDAQQLSAAKSLGTAGIKDVLTRRSAVAAGIGAEAGHLIAPGTTLGPGLGVAAGAAAGAATSAPVVRAGLGALQAAGSQAGQSAISGVTAGAAQTLGQVMKGTAGIHALTPPGAPAQQ